MASAAPAPVLPDVLLAWSADPTVLVPLALLAVGYLAAVRRVDRAHPGNPVPRARTVCWLLGLAAILVALQSPIERYDTTLFSVHMVQHILLTLVATAAPRARCPDHPAPPPGQTGDAPAGHPADPPLVAGPGRHLPRGQLAALRVRHVGQPLLAALQCLARGADASTSSSTWSTWSPRRCSGGPRSVSIPAPGGCANRPGSCTRSCRCPRTRSSGWPSSVRPRRCIPTTPR